MESLNCRKNNHIYSWLRKCRGIHICEYIFLFFHHPNHRLDPYLDAKNPIEEVSQPDSKMNSTHVDNIEMHSKWIHSF